MSSIEWSFDHSALFRAALAFLLQRNDWIEKYYPIASLVDTMNTICGYKDANDDMKKFMKQVDEEMIKLALQVDGVKSRDGGVFNCPCSDLTAAKTNNDTPQKRRRRRGGNKTRTTRRHDVVTFWVKMIDGQCKIGCSSSASWEPTCESEDDPPQVDTSTSLWNNGMRGGTSTIPKR